MSVVKGMQPFFHDDEVFTAVVERVAVDMVDD